MEIINSVHAQRNASAPAAERIKDAAEKNAPPLCSPLSRHRTTSILYLVTAILSSVLGGVTFMVTTQSFHDSQPPESNHSPHYSTHAATKSCRSINLGGGIQRQPSTYSILLCNTKNPQLIPSGIYDAIALYRNNSTPDLIHSWDWEAWAAMNDDLNKKVYELWPSEAGEKAGVRGSDPLCPTFVYNRSEVRLCFDHYGRIGSFRINEWTLNSVERNVFLTAMEAWLPDSRILNSTSTVPMPITSTASCISCIFFIILAISASTVVENL